MLDDMVDYLERLRDRPVWRPISQTQRAGFDEPVPRGSGELGEIHERFMREILPFAVGNTHPGFMGWVHGGGTPVGMAAEMLAGALNANLGGRDQIPLEVERQIVRWMTRLFGFPQTASGLFVTGSSMANFISLIVARTAALSPKVRRQGLTEKLVAYTSTQAHGCIAQAMDMAGLGTQSLRKVAVDGAYRMDIGALREAIAEDRSAGRLPFFVAATAGTVDVGAIDDLRAVADVARDQQLWFHVDGALGALGIFSQKVGPMLAGIERADSIAMDFHKWGQVPYDAGFVLVREGMLQREAFESPAAYLSREARGMAGGSPWPCDLGPDLSRGFRALKVWFTLQTYGTDRLGRMIDRTCELADYLRQRIEADDRFQRLAPVALNIVCFRYRCGEQHIDEVNRQLLIELHESGIAAPSSTRINGRFALRAAITNHRTDKEDIDAMLDAVLGLGEKITAKTQASERMPR